VPVVFWFSVGKEQLLKLPELGVPSAPPVEYLLLNVVQSVEDRYPDTEAVAKAMETTGVEVPVATLIGSVPDTFVTVPPY